MIVLFVERVVVDHFVFVGDRLRRHHDARAALLVEETFQSTSDVIDVTRLRDVVVNRSDVAAAVTGIDDDDDSGEVARARSHGELRAGALRFFAGHARRIVGGQPFRKQQLHRNLHRESDRNFRNVIDRVELHDAIDDVADIFRVDAAGEANGHRRVERFALLQPIDGVRNGSGAIPGQRRLSQG